MFSHQTWYTAASVLLLLFSGTSNAHPSSSSSSRRSPTATVRNGTYRGRYLPEYDEDLFLSVPYAQPPVGDLRFRHPQSLNTTWTGQKLVSEWGPDCIGYGSDGWANPRAFSEDCLTLSIVRPAGTKPNAGLPIGFWIHGGGGTQGGGNDPRYNTSFIVQQSVENKQPIMAINVNYRKQTWGFISGSEFAAEGSLNNAYFDQRLALYWIQENIGAFSGDPTKVTIWGESAGATSVGVYQSGSPARGYANVSAWQPTYDNITKATGCDSSADNLACLRQVPVDQLSSIFNSSVTAGGIFAGTVDGDLLVGSGLDQMRNGQFVRVPMLQGRNHDDGTMWRKEGINNDTDWEKWLQSSGYNASVIANLNVLYPDIPEVGIPPTLVGRPTDPQLGSQYNRTCAFAGDIRQHASRRFMAQMCAKYGVNTYSYHFNMFPADVTAATGVTHFAEVAWVFDNTLGVGYQNAVAFPPFAGKPRTYYNMARWMSRMWASFIADLDPNYKGLPVSWPLYTNASKVNFVMDVNATRPLYIESDTYRAEAIDFVQKLLV
ncbi:hypothetical protein KVT40_001153 [Elsinoe batatas]|uniref:Carboxylesterase type B domain-containing protein n=1 Tax=Elsinoe batatas TaxID=2601811 RepID=A0A8K0LCB3_9PEZI|nr:hypothetical protein KVT40_001153 [Elsinoe batatas]